MSLCKTFACIPHNHIRRDPFIRHTNTQTDGHLPPGGFYIQAFAEFMPPPQTHRLMTIFQHRFYTQVFAAALSGDSDTPELRWTHGMRWGRLLPQLTAHLGDTAARLAQNWSGVRWSYSPAPPITYPDLKVGADLILSKWHHNDCEMLLIGRGVTVTLLPAMNESIL